MKTGNRLAAVRAAQEPPSEGLATPGVLAERAKPLDPITQELVDQLGYALFWRIVLEPYVPKQRGMLVKAQQVEDAERILACVGRVVAVGSMAFKSKTSAGLDLADEPHKPLVGMYALHEMYAGKELTLTSGHTLRIITDSECLMLVKDPDLIRGYL